MCNSILSSRLHSRELQNTLSSRGASRDFKTKHLQGLSRAVRGKLVTVDIKEGRESVCVDKLLECMRLCRKCSSIGVKFNPSQLLHLEGIALAI